jgi:hypothetical protein
MGMKAERILNNRKENVAITTVASGEVTSPASGASIAIVSILEGADTQRFADIERSITRCYEYLREKNLYNSAGALAIVMNINDAKRDVIERGIMSNIVTGDVGVLITGTTRERGRTLIVESAFRQIIEFVRQEGRLGG